VLTSNGTAAPSWESAAFNNNVRFEADFTGSSTIDITPTPNYTTAYNLNPSAVFISGSGISISRSGLYHIEGYIEIRNDLTALPTALIQGLELLVDGRVYVQSQLESLIRDPSGPNSYLKYIRFVNEVYISAPGTVKVSVSKSFNLGPASFLYRYNYGKISGYLISD